MDSLGQAFQLYWLFQKDTPELPKAFIEHVKHEWFGNENSQRVLTTYNAWSAPNTLTRFPCLYMGLLETGSSESKGRLIPAESALVKWKLQIVK